ncbi:MAG TPA: AAA family ATPase [Acidimicrobiales bacterium]|nr:AAA family ATPase [Acidimicrobiales bacterium]
MGPVPAKSGLIGRDAELGRLGELVGLGALDEEQGRSAGVVLAGDAGMGKTRVLTELGRRAEDAGWRVLVGHCLDFGDSVPPYLPFTEMLGRLAAESPAIAGWLAESQPAIARLVPGWPTPHPAGSDPAGPEAARTMRHDLFEAVHSGLTQLGRSAPTLVVVEDVHWADRSTREMLSFLFARQFPTPVAVVASYRSDDLHRRHPLRAVIGEWLRLPGVSRVVLEPLADADVRAMVHALHPTPLPETRVRGIVERAEGNAFFTEELVAVADRGGRALPTDLVDLLLVRVDQLDDAARQVVRAASIAGRRVRHDRLAAVSGLDPERLEAAVRIAVDANVLIPVADDAYAFRHALLAEAVYDDLLPGERLRLHAAFVAVLTRPETQGTPAELARHALAAHDWPVALRASIAAGREAMAVAGPDEAARSFEHALAVAGELAPEALAAEDTDVATLTVEAAEALMAAGDVVRALTLLQDRVTHLPAGTSDASHARLLDALALTAMQTDTSVDALQASTEALQLVPADPPTPLRALVANTHARANADRRRDDEAARWALTALELARQLDLPEIAADAATTLARIEEREGDPVASRRALEQAAADAAEAGDVSAELRALYNLGSLYYALGQQTEAARAFRLTAERAKARGRPWAPYGVDARGMAGLVAYTHGDWDQLEALADVDVDETPPPAAEALLAAVRLTLAAGRGRYEAIQELDAIRPWWGYDGFLAIQSAAAAIDLYGDTGRLEAARAAYDEVVTFVQGLWQNKLFHARLRLAGLLLGHLGTAAATATAAERAGLADEAADLVAVAREVVAAAPPDRERVNDDTASQAPAPHGPEGMAWLARAEAEWCRIRWLCQEDPPDAGELIQRWEASVAAFDTFGHRFERARSRARLAAALRAVGRAAEATAAAGEARQTAALLGAEPLLRELAGLPGGVSGGVGPHSAASEAAESRPVPRDEALTARELEVLALIAAGRTNRDIGSELYISAKTVGVHVSNILAKLGARSRTEAVAVARRRGLVTDGVSG